MQARRWLPCPEADGTDELAHPTSRNQWQLPAIANDFISLRDESAEFHLQSLKVEEAGDYIKHRLSVAGGQEMLFSDPAVYAIYYFAGGVPRLINTLCEYALVYAYSTESRMIDMDAVSQIIRGRRIGGLNRLATATESMEVARSIVLESTGIDVAEMLSASM